MNIYFHKLIFKVSSRGHELIVENPQVATLAETGRWLLYERMFKREERRCTIDLFSPRSAKTKIFSSPFKESILFDFFFVVAVKMKEGSNDAVITENRLCSEELRTLVFFHVHLRKV